MLQTRIQQAARFQHQAAPELASIEDVVRKVYALVLRQYPIILAVLAACLTIAIAHLMAEPRRYSGTAELIIDTRKVQGLSQQMPSGSDSPIDSAMIDSQVEILKSETVALAVIRDLKLTEDPEFVGPSAGLLGTLLGAPALLFPSSSPASDYQILRRALKRFQSRLTVKRASLTYIIEITYQSTSPERAAQIANAVADAYIVDSLEAKYQASRRASVWLQDRIKELRAQASTAERAVVEYKAKNNIVDAGGRLLTEQQLGEINSSLTISRAQRAEAEARLSRIEQILRNDDSDSVVNDLATVTDSLKNEVIIKLRQQYLDLAQRKAIWTGRYGTSHLAVVNLQTQMREIRRAITDELGRIAESYKSDLEIAKAREDSLQKSLNSTILASNDTNQAQIVLRELESNSQSARALAENFLQLHMVSVQQQSFPITEARVITQASVNSDVSSPKTSLVLVVALLIGSILAGAAAFLRDIMDRGFRTTNDLQDRLRLSCLSAVPRVEAVKNARRPGRPTLPARKSSPAIAKERVLSEMHGVSNAVIDAPFSRFAEAIRSIKLGVEVANQRVIAFTSAVPNEGKSTLTEALAQTLAKSGAKTLLIDCDIRNPSLSRRLTPNASVGLIQLIQGTHQTADVLWRDPRTGLAFLPCAVETRFANTSDFLASNRLEALFSQFRNQFQYVVVDLSPLMPIVDVRSTVRLIEGYILVVEWAKTSIDIVERALGQAPEVHELLLGSVLNKTDPAKMRRYEGYKGGNLKDYYYKSYGYVD